VGKRGLIQRGKGGGRGRAFFAVGYALPHRSASAPGQAFVAD